MSRRESGGSRNTRSNFRRWHNRFSIGGANRTNVNSQIRQIHRKSYTSPRRAESPRPPNSARLPYDRYRYRRDFEEEEQTEFGSPSQYRDDRGRPMQRVGLFRNAKHSDVVRPFIDERMVRNVEAKIRRITRPEEFDEVRVCEREPTNSVRDRVRSVVYEMAPRNEHRRYQPNYPPEEYEGRARRRLFSPPVARYVNPKRNVLYDSGYEPRSLNHTREKRYRDAYEESIEESSIYNNNDEYSKKDHQPSVNFRRTKSIETERKRRNSCEIDRPLSRNSNRDDNVEETTRILQKEGDSFAKYQSPKSDAHRNRVDTGTPARNGSPVILKSSRSNKYVSDDKDEDNWKKSLSFLNDQNEQGMEVVKRIGNTMPSLPLMDNSEKCYSKIAFFLISQSIRNLAYEPRNNVKAKRKRGEMSNDVFNKLVNMSTSWVGSKNGSTILAGGGDILMQKQQAPIFKSKSNEVSRKEVMRDISKILHPQSLLVNNTEMEFNESVFANSGFMEADIFKSKRSVKNPTRDVYHSSPKHDNIRPLIAEGDIELSSIRQNDMAKSDPDLQLPLRTSPESDSSEENSIEQNNNDMDDYIDKGASQLTYIHTPPVRSSPTSVNYNFTNVENDIEELNMIATSPKPSELVETKDDTKSRNLFDFLQSSSASNLSHLGNIEPFVNVDAETQRMFDNAFDEYQEQERQKLTSIHRHLF